MKRITINLILCSLLLSFLALAGCSKKSDSPPKQNSTLDKLNSSDSSTRSSGVKEAEEKYGG